jgi:hypothetical protein
MNEKQYIEVNGMIYKVIDSNSNYHIGLLCISNGKKFNIEKIDNFKYITVLTEEHKHKIIKAKLKEYI